MQAGCRLDCLLLSGVYSGFILGLFIVKGVEQQGDPKPTRKNCLSLVFTRINSDRALLVVGAMSVSCRVLVVDLSRGLMSQTCRGTQGGAMFSKTLAI